MKKLFILFTAILSFSLQALSQDIITLRNGETLNVNIKYVSTYEISYEKPSMENGPIFTLPKSDIFMITYRDGSKEVIDQTVQESYNDEPLFAYNPDELVPNMRYKQLKRLYSYKDYVYYTGYEVYSPAWMGVASAFIPGLGQIIEGEVGRGLLQFFGTETIAFIGANIWANSVNVYGYDSNPLSGLFLVAGLLTMDILNVIDAVHIAKVKNMYYSDLNRFALDVKVSPYVNLAYVNTPQMQPVAGLSLSISF